MGAIKIGDGGGDGFGNVEGHRDDVADDFGFWETGFCDFDFGVVDGGFDEVFGVFAIEDGEVAAEAEGIGVFAENAIADGMKCAAPERSEILAEDVVDAAHHLAGGFVGEGKEKNLLGRDTLFEEERDAIREGAGFAGTGAGDDEGGPGRGGDGGVLLFVEFLCVIDLQRTFSTGRFQHVVARHGMKVR